MARMFTGIIRHVGTVTAAKGNADGVRLLVDPGPLAEGLRGGDSVAVNGACLTLAGRDPTAGTQAVVEFDVVAETLARTTLGALRGGSKVNLERSVRLGEALEGHMVSGHVDGVAAVRQVRRGRSWLVEFEGGGELTAGMVPKGSVAIDGVSLTLVDVRSGRFSVALIPSTLEGTTLSHLAGGDKVNIETDMIGKYVLKYLRQMGRDLAAGDKGAEVTLEKLRQVGFL